MKLEELVTEVLELLRAVLQPSLRSPDIGVLSIKAFISSKNPWV